MHIQCILPHLDYCCVIWGNCSRSLEEKIVKILKRAGRLILNKDFDTTSTFLFSQLKWMTITERVIYQKVIKMYKTLSGTSPNYLKYHLHLPQIYIQEHLDHLMKPNCIYRNQELSYLETHLYFLALQFGTVFLILYVIHRSVTYLRSDI